MWNKQLKIKLSNDNYEELISDYELLYWIIYACLILTLYSLIEGDTNQNEVAILDKCLH